MTAAQKFFLNATTAILTVTGVVFALMKYFMKSDDPFAVANHPWQPHMLHVHVVAAPLSVFVIGVVWAAHVTPKYDAGAKQRRKTGLVALWMIAPMVLSGYLMQVLTSERLVEAMRITHWVSSAVFVLGIVVHQLLRIAGGGGARVAPAIDERDVW